jgi:hypothetical protein
MWAVQTLQAWPLQAEAERHGVQGGWPLPEGPLQSAAELHPGQPGVHERQCRRLL